MASAGIELDALKADAPLSCCLLAHAPAELTGSRLRRLGEGIGKVVYASDHWVVKRERSPSEVVALIAIWKALRRAAHWLPAGLGDRLLRHPSRIIRLIRVGMQGIVYLIPRSLWMATHIGEVWRVYTSRDARGQDLATTFLTGTPFVPTRVTFPPTRVRVGGWPGWLTTSEAVERVEETLHQRLTRLGRQGRFEELEMLLEKFLTLRQSGWRRGLFSVDAHLKNFGVIQDRIVLLDAGGLTDRWEEIEQRLSYEDVVGEPHIQLGLGPVLGARPDIARRFNERWKATVNLAEVRRHWPNN